MENDSPLAEKPPIGLPQAKAFPSRATGEPKVADPVVGVTEPGNGAVRAAAESNDKSGVFQHLVREDADITGLVAYSIYKQNKLDWLRAFEAAKGRAPNEAELASYIVGEGTPRRLATYRHLAEATLAGNGPDIDGMDTRSGGPLVKRFNASQGKALTTSVIASYALIAIVAVILFWVALRFTMSSH